MESHTMREQRPQGHSFRPLQAAALSLVASVATAQGIAGTRHRIAEADVAKELSVIGLNVGVSQVHLPAYISSETEAPKLEIVTVEPIGANQVRLELSCPTASDCLPFFATLDVKEPDLFSAEVRLKTREAIGANHQPATRIGAAPINQAKLRVGSHVVLLIRDGHVDIHLQVLAIDSGAIGQQVRVCTLDRKKVFRATVTGEDTVTGMME
jgi:hypothetical protein